MANFIVQFPLKTEKYQEDILDKRFEIGRQIYNSLVNVTQKRYKEMIKTTKYRNLMSKLSGDKKKDKGHGKKDREIGETGGAGWRRAGRTPGTAGPLWGRFGFRGGKLGS